MTSAVAGTATEETADELRHRAREIYFEEGPKAALPLFEEALSVSVEAGDRAGEAIALGLIGNCHKRLGDLGLALDFLNRALWLKRALGERFEEGKTLSHLGLLHWEMGRYAEAIDYIERSNVIAEEVGDLDLKGANLINLALVRDELGDYDASLAGYREALEIYRELDLPDGMSDALGNLGGVHLLLGRYREALDYYEQSRAISEREGLKLSLSQDLGNLGLTKLGLGRIDDARADFDRALELARETGAAQEEAYWLKGSGQALVTAGLYGEGLGRLRDAVALYEEIGAEGELVEALHDLGVHHLRLGDLASAEDLFLRGVELARRIGHARGQTYHLLALGDLETGRRRLEQASALYAEALARAEEGGETSLAVDSLLRLAGVRRELGPSEEARRAAARALELARQMASPGLEAAALLEQAETERVAGSMERAIESYVAAETALAGIGNPELLWRLHHGRGLALEAAGRPEAAIEALRAAAEVIEGIRARLREERFRAGYLEDKYQVYVDLVRLLLESGRVEEAFQSAERLRARSYLEMLDRAPPRRAVDEERRRELELRERIRRLERALEHEGRGGAGMFRQTAANLLSNELAAAERDYQSFLDDLRRRDLEAVGLREPDVPSVAEVAARLPRETGLLEYMLAEDRVLAFVVTSSGVRAASTAVGRSEVEAAVELLRDLVQRGDGDEWRAPARRLHELLVEPLEGEGWLEGLSGLYVVPHGALHYLPFGVLLGASPGGEGGTSGAVPVARALVERYVLAVLPSAAALPAGRAGSDADLSLLALAPRRSGLRYAQEEIEAVGTMFPGRPEILGGASASEAAFKSMAPRFSVLHLASHAYFNQLNPLLSGVELEPERGEDGDLEVHEILELDLPASIVVLSACETAMAGGHFGRLPAGDDLVGLTRSFLYAGSQSVLATLWRVDDRSTAQLMRGFYGHLAAADGRLRRAAALARAQRRAIEAGGRLAHPYFWAPFVLAGGMG